MTTTRADAFGVWIESDAAPATVGVRGDVDTLTAPAFAAALAIVVDHSHPDAIIDLGALTFMDAAGLGVIADAAGRIAASGGMLTLRSVPLQTLAILHITGVNELVRIDMTELLGTEQHQGDNSRQVQSASAHLPSDLARSMSAPTTDGTIGYALRLVTSLASATVGGADGVSVSLQRQGRLTTVASSNDTVLRMDQHQYETSEGPCIAAASRGHWFHIESLAAEKRWPSFIPLAIDEGIASILSTPLMVGDRPVGALNIYSNTEGAFGTDEQALAAMFATQASAFLADAGATTTDQQLGSRIADALLSREIIAQAKGILMARLSITADDASTALHNSARAASMAVRTQAAEVIGSTAAPIEPAE